MQFRVYGRRAYRQTAFMLQCFCACLCHSWLTASTGPLKCSSGDPLHVFRKTEVFSRRFFILFAAWDDLEKHPDLLWGPPNKFYSVGAEGSYPG
jgi:hypothetical protein